MLIRPHKNTGHASNDYTSYLISSHKRKTGDGWLYGSPHSAFRIAFNPRFALVMTGAYAKLPGFRLCWLEVDYSMTSGARSSAWVGINGSRSRTRRYAGLTREWLT
jgi:hypothetical protein